MTGALAGFGTTPVSALVVGVAGAYFVGAGHYYLGHVPLLQNSKAGSVLNSFFLAQRVTQDSTFWLTVTN